MAPGGERARLESVGRPDREEPILEPWYRIAKGVVIPPIKLWFNWQLEGLDRIPAEGPIIVAGNHISYMDPLAMGLFVTRAGRRPRFLGKAELFDNWFTGPVLRGAGQIPVRRGTGDSQALDAAAEVLRAGEVFVIYPEGTVTKHEDFSPMRGKTGAVRLALATGVKILPVAIWGSQAVWQKSGKGSLKFGRPIWLRAGEAIDLSAHAERANDSETLRGLADRLMEELSAMVQEMRALYPKRWA